MSHLSSRLPPQASSGLCTRPGTWSSLPLKTRPIWGQRAYPSHPRRRCCRPPPCSPCATAGPAQTIPAPPALPETSLRDSDSELFFPRCQRRPWASAPGSAGWSHVRKLGLEKLGVAQGHTETPSVEGRAGRSPQKYRLWCQVCDERQQGPGAQGEPRGACRGQLGELTGVCRHVPGKPQATRQVTLLAGVGVTLAPWRAWVGSSLTVPSLLCGPAHDLYLPLWVGLL